MVGFLLQGSLPFSAQRLNQAHDSDKLESNKQLHFNRTQLKQIKGTLSPENACFVSATELCPTGERQSKIEVPHLKMDQQLQHESSACFVFSRAPLSADPVTDPQASSTHKSPVSAIKNHHEFCIEGSAFPEKNLPSGKDSSCSWASSCQTSTNNATEIPNYSGEESNSPTSQSPKACRDGYLSNVTTGCKKCGIGSEAITTNPGKVGRAQEEPEEIAELTNIDVKPSLFSNRDSCANNLQHDCSSNGEQKHATEREKLRSCHTTEVNWEDQVAAQANEEECKVDSVAEEACESIAANILLSFAHCRSRSDANKLCFWTQIGAESSQSSKDSTGLGNNRTARWYLNYNEKAGADETANWTKSVQGRRRRNRRRQQ